MQCWNGVVSKGGEHSVWVAMKVEQQHKDELVSIDRFEEKRAVRKIEKEGANIS